jgi:hypothetical protein
MTQELKPFPKGTPMEHHLQPPPILILKRRKNTNQSYPTNIDNGSNNPKCN